MAVVAKRFDVHLVTLNPTIGSEINKTRPCLIVSPDEANRHLSTVIVAPMTTQGKAYPTRIPCVFESKAGIVVLDQLRTVDKTRLLKNLGRLTKMEQTNVTEGLSKLFAL